MENTNTNLEAIIADIEAKAQAKALNRRVAMLSTESGANRMLRKKDNSTLQTIASRIAEVNEKPVFTGYTFNSNVETIVAIAQSLQFMKGDLRESIPETVWAVFDHDTRTEILEAYGRLPYLADELTIEVDGKHIVVDPEARERAKRGVQADVSELELLVNTVAINLNLLGEYTCTQREADQAWLGATRKIAKAEVLEAYKDSL